MNFRSNIDKGEDIQRICAFLGLTDRIILGKTKRREIVEARAVLAYILKRWGWPIAEISRRLKLTRFMIRRYLFKAEQVLTKEKLKEIDKI